MERLSADKKERGFLFRLKKFLRRERGGMIEKEKVLSVIDGEIKAILDIMGKLSEDEVSEDSRVSGDLEILKYELVAIVRLYDQIKNL